MAGFSFQINVVPILVSIDKFSLKMIHVLNKNHTIIFLSRLRHEKLFTATNDTMEVKLTSHNNSNASILDT